ncbi:hypothetical protein SUGI_0997980 [Cryptomeria japonica]|uniref:uncharacterized protein LOC131072593 n=1 Tax=Cryptomeria japonica TaxID=3369 RepID=UPI002414AE54|nr:uncharacterized protein LOC131072593 [Cryptomeria japonica]GLJ47260.1 hypothetical protein SUGI_0997980 [Cryptomeria japonica]
MVHSDETIELIDVSLHRSSSSRDTREEIWVQNPIGDNATEREENVLCRLPSNLNIAMEQFNSLTALEILRETVRILRFNSTAFLTVAAVFICPVSAIFLSNFFVNQSKVEKLSLWFQLVAESIGFPKGHFARSGFHKLSESVLSFVFCFPFYITLLLFSKAIVVYSVALTYASKKLLIEKFLTMIRKIWKHLVLTYLWNCITILGCIVIFLLLVLVSINAIIFLGVPPTWAIYVVLGEGVIFSLLFAHAMIICNLAIVVSILEDYYGMGAFFRSMFLIKERTQVGLLIFLGTCIGTAFVEGLFDHRVKTVSYGDGSSRIWEGPLLVIMHSFVILIDAMMSCIFYFTCKWSTSESFDSASVLELNTSFSEQREQNNENGSSS